MAHDPFLSFLPVVLGKWNVDTQSSWLETTFVQPFRIVYVETLTPGAFRRSRRSGLLRAWIVKNRSSLADAVFCLPPPCRLISIPYSWNLPRALVIIAWCTPRTSLTWRWVAPCFTILTARHISASDKCRLTFRSPYLITKPWGFVLGLRMNIIHVPCTSTQCTKMYDSGRVPVVHDFNEKSACQQF